AASRLARDPGDVGRHAIAISLRHAETALGPPPEHVVARAGPFLVDEIIDLGSGETLTEVLAQIGRRSGVAQDRHGYCAVPMRKAAHQIGRDRRIAPGELPDELAQPSRRQVATRKHGMRGPAWLHGWKERRELVERVL